MLSGRKPPRQVSGRKMGLGGYKGDNKGGSDRCSGAGGSAWSSSGRAPARALEGAARAPRAGGTSALFSLSGRPRARQNVTAALHRVPVNNGVLINRSRGRLPGLHMGAGASGKGATNKGRGLRQAGSCAAWAGAPPAPASWERGAHSREAPGRVRPVQVCGLARHPGPEHQVQCVLAVL
jgi:hypothetical protein